MSNRRVVTFGLLAIAVSLTGCAAAPRPPRDAVLRYHVIQFDGDGKTIDPVTGQKQSRKQTRDQFTDILARLDTELADRPKRNILILVHGGLTKPDVVIDSVPRRLQQFDGLDFFPIFVVWDSSLETTYGEHLFAIRQGRKDKTTEAAASLSWPIYFLTDVLRSFARAPTVWLQQRSTDDQAAAAAWGAIFSDDDDRERDPTQADRGKATSREAWMNHPRNDKTVAFYNELYARYLNDWVNHGQSQTAQIAISVGPDLSETSDWVGRGAFYVLTFPTKTLTSPLIDAFGSAGWRNMSRRTQTLVEGASDFELGDPDEDTTVAQYVNRGTRGGLDYFVQRLDASAKQAAEKGHPYRITLVGHSMGSMVINEVLRRQVVREDDDRRPRKSTTAPATRPEKPPHVLPIDNVVYMAAACTIRDFTESVVPFLGRPGHEDARFYNLCLHPTAELIESNVYDIPPRGSLLCWIDDFLSEPSTPLDRTLGRWENFLQVPYVIPSKLRGRVGIKAFSLLRDPEQAFANPDDPQPQHHGDFGICPFWEPWFWKPLPPTDADQARIKRAAEQRGAKIMEQKRQQQSPQQQQRQQQPQEDLPEPAGAAAD